MPTMSEITASIKVDTSIASKRGRLMQGLTIKVTYQNQVVNR